MAVQIIMPKQKDPTAALSSALSIYSGLKGAVGGGGDAKPDMPKDDASAMARKMETMAITEPPKAAVVTSPQPQMPQTISDLEQMTNPLKRRVRGHGFMPELG